MIDAQAQQKRSEFNDEHKGIEQEPISEHDKMMRLSFDLTILKFKKQSILNQINSSDNQIQSIQKLSSVQ